MDRKFFSPIPSGAGEVPEEVSLPSVEEGSLEESKTSEPIARRLNDLEKGGAETVETPLPEDTRHLKHEAYALGAYLIKRYHEGVKKILKENPEEIASSIVGVAAALEVFTVDEEEGLNVDQMKLQNLDPTLFKKLCYNNSLPKIYDSLFKKAMAQEKRKEQKTFTEKDNRVYARLAKLLYDGKFRGYERGAGRGVHSVENFLAHGLGTATFESWAILVSVVKLYQQHFKQELTPEVLDMISKDMKEILIRVSSLHIQDFQTLTRNRIPPSGDVDSLEGAWDNLLEFSGTASHPHLELREFIFKVAQIPDSENEYYRLYDQELQQGCPARDVRVEGKNGRKVSLVADVFDFYEGIAKQLVLPRQRLLLSH